MGAILAVAAGRDGKSLPNIFLVRERQVRQLILLTFSAQIDKTSATLSGVCVRQTAMSSQIFSKAKAKLNPEERRRVAEWMKWVRKAHMQDPPKDPLKRLPVGRRVALNLCAEAQFENVDKFVDFLRDLGKATGKTAEGAFTQVIRRYHFQGNRPRARIPCGTLYRLVRARSYFPDEQALLENNDYYYRDPVHDRFEETVLPLFVAPGDGKWREAVGPWPLRTTADYNGSE